MLSSTLVDTSSILTTLNDFKRMRSSFHSLQNFQNSSLGSIHLWKLLQPCKSLSLGQAKATSMEPTTEERLMYRMRFSKTINHKSHRPNASHKDHQPWAEYQTSLPKNIESTLLKHYIYVSQTRLLRGHQPTSKDSNEKTHKWLGPPCYLLRANERT